MANIRLERSQSILKEVLSEALCELANPMLNSLSVTNVICSKGKYNARVFVESGDFSKEERTLISKELRKAEGILREYVLNSLGWFRCPKFTFEFDDGLAKANSLEKIFESIRNGK